jgi:hypothetical protein
MKQLEDLTKDECQKFLDNLFEEENVEYIRMVFESENKNIDCCGIEYNIKNELDSKWQHTRIVSFSNPELIIWLYKHNVDITIPLKHMMFDFIDMDETNSILFEYVMSVNKIINEYLSIKPVDSVNETAFLQEMGPIFVTGINKIKRLQKDLIKKL